MAMFSTTGRSWIALIIFSWLQVAGCVRLLETIFASSN